jgi:hypothetical protein
MSFIELVNYFYKLASNWGNLVSGEWWITPAGEFEFADIDVGDYGHEYIAVNYLFDKDIAIDLLKDKAYNDLKLNIISEEECNEILEKLESYTNEDPAALFFNEEIPNDIGKLACDCWDDLNKDPRLAFAKKGAILVIDTNFYLWKLTKDSIENIKNFIFENSQMETELENSDNEIIIEEASTKKSSTIPFNEFLMISNPGEIWRLNKLAMPFDSELFDSLHSKHIRETIPKDREVIVYHGTSSKRFVKILQYGSLDPVQSIENKAWENTTSGGIYVTRKFEGFTGAESYARHSSTNDGGDGSDPTILEIVIPLSWIELDEDDLKIDPETGKINDLGENQGVVKRSINIKRIRRIMFKGKEISQISKAYSSNVFDLDKTEFLPVGIMLDKIKKAINKGIELPPEYYQMVNSRPKGLSKREPIPEREEIIAKELESLYDNLFDPTDHPHDKSVYENALIYVFNNKNMYDLEKYIKNFILYVGQDPEYFENAYDMPRKGENIISYLKRI